VIFLFSSSELIDGAKLILVVVAVVLLAYGFHRRNSQGHLLSAGGWAAFAVYWLIRTPPYLADGDYFSAFFTAGAVPFFLYIGYHEYLLAQGRGEADEEGDNHSLKFMAGTGFIAGGIYFLIEYVEVVHAGLVWFTAYQGELLLRLFGYEISLGDIRYDEDMIRVPVLREGHAGSNIFIVLACTAIQSLVVFVGAIYSTRGDRKRKMKAFLYTVPVVHVLNIVRNAGVIYLVYEGHMEFNFAHNYLSRYGAMFVLIVLVYIMFDILPELHEDIMGIMDLFMKPVRKRLEEMGVLKPGAEGKDGKDEKKDEEESGGKNGEAKADDEGNDEEDGGNEDKGLGDKSGEVATDDDDEKDGGDCGEGTEQSMTVK